MKTFEKEQQRNLNKEHLQNIIQNVRWKLNWFEKKWKTLIIYKTYSFHTNAHPQKTHDVVSTSIRRLIDVETTSCVYWVGILCKKRYEQSLLRWGFTCHFKRLLYISRKTLSILFADRDNNFLDYWILFAVRTYLYRVCSFLFISCLDWEYNDFGLVKQFLNKAWRLVWQKPISVKFIHETVYFELQWNLWIADTYGS